MSSPAVIRQYLADKGFDPNAQTLSCGHCVGGDRLDLAQTRTARYIVVDKYGAKSWARTTPTGPSTSEIYAWIEKHAGCQEQAETERTKRGWRD